MYRHIRSSWGHIVRLLLLGAIAACSSANVQRGMGLRPTPTTISQLPGVIATPTPAAYVSGTSRQQIAFASNPEGSWDIYLLDAASLLDGSASSGPITQLTHNPANDRGPVWSPDGRQIAFYSDRDGNAEIYLMAGDGSGITRLTDEPGYDADPAWSPDGQRLVFVSDRDGNPELYMMGADGGGLVRLTDHPGNDGLPAWSPDGRQIAFTSDRDGNAELYIVAAAGNSPALRLTFHTSDDISPAWSPDGAWLAFVSNRSGNAEVYLLNVNDTLASGASRAPLQVTSTEMHEWTPAWSPDGRWLSFVVETAQGAELYALPVAPVMASLGPEAGVYGIPGELLPVWLTGNELSDLDPDWRP